MRCKLVALGIILLFFGSIFLSPLIRAEEGTTENQDSGLLIDKFFEKFFLWAYKNKFANTIIFPDLGTAWKAGRFSTPPFFIIEPKSIDFKYLNQTKMLVGMAAKEGEGFREDYETQAAAESEYYEFDLEFPEGIDENAWTYTFSPKIVYPTGGKVQSVLTLTSTQPDYNISPTNLVFKINITRHLFYGNLYLLPEGNEKVYREEKNYTEAQILVMKITWPISAILGNFGKLSGSEDIKSVYVDLMVRAERYHLAQLDTFDTVRLKPDDVEAIPIEIHNLGSHEDSFNFRVKNNGNNDLVVSPPSAVTLGSNKVKTVYVSVATPRRFNDPGTLHEIEVQAYSIYDENQTFSNTLSVVTEGIYVSEGNVYYSVPIIFLVLAILGFAFYKRKKKLEVYCEKPEKPWNIPEEEQHLEELKKKNKDKYEKELQMMEDEYKSELLWYKSYRDFVLTEIRRKKSKERESKVKKEKAKPKKKKEKKKPKKKTELKIGKIFTELFKKEKKPKAKKEKPKKQKEIPEKKPEKPKPIKEVKVKKPSPTQSRKQKIIEKIKREQEKQKLKLGD